MLCDWEGNRIGLASHWPYVTDSVVYTHLRAQWPMKAPRLRSSRVRHLYLKPRLHQLNLLRAQQVARNMLRWCKRGIIHHK